MARLVFQVRHVRGSPPRGVYGQVSNYRNSHVLSPVKGGTFMLFGVLFSV